MRYEKGRKDSSRIKIMEAASERFRSDGIAASGLATIMSDAGLTNGAFYPHFASKADLVRECVVQALETQSQQLREALASGGIEAAIATYLSAAHRDNPSKGCASAALLPEIARQPTKTRQAYTDQLQTLVGQISAALVQTKDSQSVALGVLATLFGALELARAVEGKELSDRVLAAGANAARSLIQSPVQQAAVQSDQVGS
jgi:AcrR family transcriptional regulator